MRRPRFQIVILAAVILLLAPSCESPDADPLADTGQTTFQLYLTDAPGDFMNAAEVSITRAYLMPDHVDLIPPGDGPRVLDLLQLRDGIQALLGERPVPPGIYNQLRLVVDSAAITLSDPFTYRDGSKTQQVRIGSARETGIKVDLDQPIDVLEGMVTLLVVDFDVDQSFVMQGDPFGPQGIYGWLFVPVIVETDRGRTTAI